MTTSTSREVEHDIVVDAPPERVYDLIAQVSGWPNLFPPTVHAEQLETTGHSERIRIWATANGTVKTWVSRRELDPQRRTIGFRQEVSAAPVAGMSGTWVVEPLSASTSRVRLLHAYRAVDDDPDALDWIDRAVDQNSRVELAALKGGVELVTRAGPPRLLTFADAVRVRGAAADVYDFLNEAQSWTERLPHVRRVELTEQVAGLQTLEMDTETADGSVHTTRSVRVCLPTSRIVYKQTTLPALLRLHTGEWTIEPDPDRPDTVVVTSRHTVVVDEANIPRVLGPEADLAAAQAFVRTALSANSGATLARARDHAQDRSGRAGTGA